MSQTLKVPASSLKRVKLAMEKQDFPSQKALAEALEISLYKVREFMAGRPIDQEVFIKICDRLELEWQKIARISGVKATSLVSLPSALSEDAPAPPKRTPGIPRLASHLFRVNAVEPEEESVSAPPETMAENTPGSETVPPPNDFSPLVEAQEQTTVVSEISPEPAELLPVLVTIDYPDREEVVIEETTSESEGDFILLEEANLPILESVVSYSPMVETLPPDIDQFIACCHGALENQDWDSAGELIHQASWKQFEQLGKAGIFLDLHESLLPLHWRRGGRRVTDPLLHAWILSRAGIAAYGLGLINRALGYNELALAMTRQLQERSLERQTLKGLAIVHQALGNYQAAISHHQQYFDLVEAEDDFEEQAITLYHLGNIYFALHQYRTAIGYYVDFVGRKDENTLFAETINVFRNLGGCYLSLKSYQQSIPYLEKYLAMVHQLHDREKEAYASIQLGTAYAGLGLHHTALEHLEQSRSIAAPLDNPDLEMAAVRGMSLSYVSQGNFTEADRWGREWLTLARILGNRDEQVQAMYSLRRVQRSKPIATSA